MKNFYSIKNIICTISFGLAIFCARAGEINTYQWIGGSGQWSDIQHWIIDGNPVTSPPSQNDRVFISADESPIVVSLTQNIEVESIFTSGQESISFSAMQSVDLTVVGSFVLSPATDFNTKINILLQGVSDDSFIQLSPGMGSKLKYGKKSHYSKLTNLEKGGGCPYFTIVPNPTKPTCNGFSNGVASVLEPTDGVGPYTYQWIGGPQTQQWNNVGAGTYTVIVIDVGHGLPCNADIFVNEPGPLTVFEMNAVAPLCADACNGEASPIIIGGNGGYSFSWSSGETSASATMLCPVFTLQIEDQSGCITDTTFTFPNTPDTILFSADITDVDCFGNGNGAIDLTISGGVGGFTPSWTGPNGFTSNNEDISGLEAGDYTITVSDGNGCFADSTFTITENQPITAATTKTDNGCAGAADGAISVTPSGGSGIYSFIWTGPASFTSTDQNLTNLVAGIYELTITDDAGCTFTEQVTITEPASMDINFTSTNILCAGGTSGAASATATGGSPGYIYTWTGPNGFSANGPGISNLSSGIYVVSVTDANTCLKLDSVTISQPDSLLISFSQMAITCNDRADGTIDLNLSGGVPPFSISWTGPNGFTSTDNNLTNLGPGIYTASVIDGNGCNTSDSEELQNPSSIVLDAVITDLTCPTGNTGSIDLTTSGGVAPYDFVWTGSGGFTSTNEDISNLQAGTYMVTANDAGGCDASGSFVVDAPDPITATFVTVNASCFGALDGSIETSPSGGTPPYSFLWVGPSGYISTDQNISGLQAGGYSIQISDANGCFGFVSVNLTQPTKIKIANLVTQVTCFGGSDGAIDVLVSGGSPGYTYEWIGPNGFTSSQADITGLSAGSYTLTVTDNIGCSNSRDFNITQAAEIVADATIQDVICSGDSDGSIAISLTNGVAPFTYSWVGPNAFASTDEDIDNLEPGDYTLTVTDANLCSVVNTYTLNYTTVILVDANITDVTCFSNTDGAIEATVSGGLEPYQISWTGPNGFVSSDMNISDLASGDYSISIIDDNGCAFTQNFTVAQPDELLANLVKTDITCAGDDNGSLSANLSGGTQPYTISWAGPNGFTSQNENLTDLEAGNYYLSVVDFNNCTLVDSAEVINPDSILVDIQVTQPSCLIDNGQLEATVTGGVITTDYTYEWTNGNGDLIATTALVSNLSPGDYTLSVSDDNGCSVLSTVQLTRIVFNLISSVQNISCNGAADGAISVAPTNGTPPFSYAWTGPGGFTSTDSELIDLLPGNYTLHVEDGAGCAVDLDYDIQQPDAILANGLLTPIGCAGDSTGVIDLNPSGGSPGYFIEWTGPDGFVATGFSISDLAEGTYQATISDLHNCIADTTIVLDPGFNFILSFDPISPQCSDGSNGSINLNVNPPSGALVNYTYAWTGPDGFSSPDQNVSNIPGGIYTVLVTTDGGCTLADTIDLIAPEPILLDLEISNSNCTLSDGGAGITVSGGVGPYSINWLNSSNDTIAFGDTLQNVPAGIYTVSVADAVGCVVLQMFPVSDNSGNVDGIVSNPICHDGAEGSIDITVIDGTEPFTYEWTDGTSVISTDEDLTDLLPGTYSILVTDDNGCIYSASFEIQNPEPITTVVTKTGVSCFGNDGSIALSLSAGSEPYVVSWSGPDGYTGTGETITSLEPGMYYFDIVDSNLCSISDSVEVELVPPLLLDADIANIACGGDSTGAITLAVTGGQIPYAFSWSGANGFSSGDQNISNLIAGDYTVTVTDASNCESEQTYTVNENAPIEVDFTIANPDCGSDNGSISAVISGGFVTSDYFIQWTNQNGDALPPQTDLTDLSIGIYSLVVSDDNGCAFDTTIVLSNPDANITATIGDISCAGDTSGTIDLTVQDVEEPFTVSWTGPMGFSGNGISLTDLIAGEYAYTVVGANACTYTGLVEVAEPDSLLATVIVSNTCFGGSSGSILITLSGGVPDYTISWSGPDGFSSTAEDLVGITPGVYTLLVSDDNGCGFRSDYEVIENPKIIFDANIVEIGCHGDSSGSIELLVSGGQPPLSTEWIGPDGFVSSEDTISGLLAGDYLLTIVDSIGCSRDTVFSISEPDDFTVGQTVISAGCSSVGSTGYIALVVTGGTPDYSIDWSGPGGFTANTLIIDDLEAGTYSYTITDAASCQKSGSVELLSVEPLSATVSTTESDCYGEAGGTATTSVTGGMAPYSYSWVGPDGFTSNEADINNLVAGNYSLVLSDSAGCTTAENIDILQPDSISINLDSYSDASCISSADGTITPEISGGTEPYTAIWTGPGGFESQQLVLTDLSYGGYELTITDTNGCSNEAEVTLGYILEISVDAGNDLTFCESDLPVTIQGTGENADQFVWTNFSGDTLSTDSTLVIDDAPGLFSFVLTAGNGLCSIGDTVNIAILNNPEVDAGPDLEVFAEAEFTLGGHPTSPTGLAYFWSPQADGSFDQLAANPSGNISKSTLFTVQVTDANGCKGIDSVYVSIIPEVTAASGITPNDDGINDTWIIDNMELFPNNVVQIFDRWGIVLYSKTGYNAQNAWDGTYNGKPVPVGTYYYTIELNDSRFPDPMTGPLTIYR